MIQFFAPDILSDPRLPDQEAAHCVKVLRHVPGDEITVVDGKGWRYRCRLTEATNKRAEAEVVDREEVRPYWPSPITIAVAPTKHLDRMEWLVEKLTEVGFDRFIPLLCRFSERKELKTERLEKIAVSAMKQSLKASLPEIAPMTPFKKFIADTAGIPQRFIAHCDPSTPRRLLCREYDPAKEVLVLIGPEGDFSPEEIATALEAGFVPVSLGEARLRTETAALAACQTLHTVGELASQ